MNARTLTVIDGQRSDDAATAKAFVRMTVLADELSSKYPERASIIRGILTAILAGEHALLLGPPGTAKSALIRAIATALVASYFETLLGKFSTPEQVFGPLKISLLPHDRYSRNYQEFAPGKQIVFLDECFKSNIAMLNALLTLLNERLLHDDGKVVKVPLLSCMAASNELPESDELNALDDRLLSRFWFSYVKEESSFDKLMDSEPSDFVIGSRVDIVSEQAAVKLVDLTRETKDALKQVWRDGVKVGVTASDRRWMQFRGLIRASAHFDGRTVTEPEDLECLEDALWKKPDERAACCKLIQQTVNPAGAEAVSQMDMAKDLFARLPVKGTVTGHEYMNRTGIARKDIGAILAKVKSLPSGRKTTAALKEVNRLYAEVSTLAFGAVDGL